MHLRKYQYLSAEDKKEITEAFELVRQQRVLPSMRTMQFGGTAVEAINARAYNCSVRHIDSIRSFSEVFYLLLCGCGVGLGLTQKFLHRLPDLVSAKDKTGTVITYVIEDTIEGWADSIEALLNCYFVNTAYSGRKIVFDYSKIRPAGAPLKTGGGKAPGHKPLKNAHIKIKRHLDNIIEDLELDRMRSIDVYDILMHTADAVIAGGVRRSATIVIFDKEDDFMMNAKTGDWFTQNPQRARSNNTVLLQRDNVTQEEFHEIIQRTREWGEPGFMFADSTDVLTNPCGEIGFIPVTENGECGVQFCNLTTINGQKASSAESLFESIAAASLIGTLQAGYTDFPYLSHICRELTTKEALLGVSMTAMMAHPTITLDPSVQQKCAQIAKDVNEDWARRIGINPAARVTCVKPEGTSSLLVGTMLSGIHPAHSRKLFRRVQANKLDNVSQFLKMYNPHMAEDSAYSANGTDDVLTFPIIVDDGAYIKSDLTALQHLEIIKSTQENYVLPGTRDEEAPTRHNVSCTVIVDEQEWKDVVSYIYQNRKAFTAVSFVPRTADKAYEQAPMESVSTPEDEERFAYLLRNLIPMDYTLLTESEDGTSPSLEAACAGPKGCEFF
jgi:ribonucleoside-diphosphate reductase alpha chain